MAAGMLAIGDPEEFAKTVQTYADTGADQLVFGMLSSTMPIEIACEAVETFGRHVLPQFDKDPEHSTTRQRREQLEGGPVWSDRPPASVGQDDVHEHADRPRTARRHHRTRVPRGAGGLDDGSFLVVQIKAGPAVPRPARRHGDDGRRPRRRPEQRGRRPRRCRYVCNNGGFPWSEFGDWLLPMDLLTGANAPPDHGGGWIERVDLDTGESTVLYRECNGHALRGPNDLVFDARGNLWFTDFGKTSERTQDRGGLYFAAADGSSIVEVAYGLLGPNGVGPVPRRPARLRGRDLHRSPPGLGPRAGGGAPPDTTGPTHGGTVVAATDGHLDSLAVEADGTVVVAALTHGLFVVRPDGHSHLVPLPDPMTTNICFGGPDRRTAYITLSAEGRLVAADWPRPGLALTH